MTPADKALRGLALLAESLGYEEEGQAAQATSEDH